MRRKEVSLQTSCLTVGAVITSAPAARKGGGARVARVCTLNRDDVPVVVHVHDGGQDDDFQGHDEDHGEA